MEDEGEEEEVEESRSKGNGDGDNIDHRSKDKAYDPRGRKDSLKVARSRREKGEKTARKDPQGRDGSAQPFLGRDTADRESNDLNAKAWAEVRDETQKAQQALQALKELQGLQEQPEQQQQQQQQHPQHPQRQPHHPPPTQRADQEIINQTLPPLETRNAGGRQLRPRR